MNGVDVDFPRNLAKVSLDGIVNEVTLAHQSLPSAVRHCRVNPDLVRFSEIQTSFQIHSMDIVFQNFL